MSQRHTIKVHWSNGDHTVTDINGTKEEVEQYYLNNTFTVRHWFNEVKVTATKIEFL